MKHAGKTKAQLISELEEVSQGLAENALKEALQQKITELNSFLNNIPDMAWLKDIESRFIAVNKAFGEAVEMDPESLVNHTCEVCFGEEGSKKFQEDDWKVMESGKQRVIEEQIVDSRGKEVWLETIKSPILDELGKVGGTVGIARDCESACNNDPPLS